MFEKLLGICVILGALYWIAHRVGLTTFIKGLVGYTVIGILLYCAFKAFPEVWAFLAPWLGITIVILVLWGLKKLIFG